MTTLTVASYNLHKGFSALGRRFVLHDMRSRLLELNVDIAFLQEVQGQHERHSRRLHHYPTEPQHEFLFREEGMTALYGRNAEYAHGHHGNALVTRLNVLAHENIDISHHRLEHRGMLLATLAASPGRELYAVCTHLGLLARSRRAQIGWIVAALRERVPDHAPLIIAGDFNDWRRQACRELAQQLGLQEVFAQLGGKPPRTFPAMFPVVALDRIYVRGIAVLTANRHAGGAWGKLSDHAAVTATLQMN
jgi:endonuclease/exonuclease/phosphatase family metal-dependent hydrolase